MSSLFVRLQQVLPQHLLSRVAYGLTRSRTRWVKDALIGAFVRGYRPRMDDALEPDPRRYASFNDFFTRPLKPGARPVPDDGARVVSPADGVLSALGEIDDETLLQAKGRHFTLTQLLAGGADWVERLRGGSYATVYLAPCNYHRVHMPANGTLVAAWHVPGRLFSVNDATAAGVEALFARNERVVCAFEGERTPFAVVLVGALFVGSMTTVWHGEVTPRPARGVAVLEPGAAHAFQPRAAELGHFNMGSTVIMLWPRGAVRWDAALARGAAVRVGLGLGSLR